MPMKSGWATVTKINSFTVGKSIDTIFGKLIPEFPVSIQTEFFPSDLIGVPVRISVYLLFAKESSAFLPQEASIAA